MLNTEYVQPKGYFPHHRLENLEICRTPLVIIYAQIPKKIHLPSINAKIIHISLLACTTEMLKNTTACENSRAKNLQSNFV